MGDTDILRQKSVSSESLFIATTKKAKAMQRKNISVIMRCMIVSLLLSIGLLNSAAQIWIDDFRYIVLSEEDRTVAVDLMKDVSGNKQEYVIPDIVNIDGIDYTVTTIRKIKPRVYNGTISLTVPATVKYIEEWAFASFFDLRHIEFECDRLEEVGASAFWGCENLSSFDFSKLPSDPEKVGNGVFYRSGITEVEWPEYLAVVPEKMFFNSAVTKLKLPPTVTTVSTAAFTLCKIDTLSIPDNVVLREQAFACNFDLKELRLGEGCHLYATCLSYNSDLEKIVLPSGTRIYGCPFFDMLNLCELELAADVEFYNGAQLLALDSDMIYYVRDNDLGEYLSPEFHYSSNPIEHGSLYEGYGRVSPNWKQYVKKVIYHTDAPQYIGDYDIVRQKDYDTATLYVEPKGLNRARVINPWKNFHNIAPLDIVTGIENTDLDSAEEAGAEFGCCGYYTLSGVYVGDNFDSLSRGVYISRTTDGIRKIIK
ncbi:MAG: leucine-rich repeat domain-containing protein [Bacteroides sp.]|nr:leucine-rich repeat domain-containing protein [Bacteroides sp.]